MSRLLDRLRQRPNRSRIRLANNADLSPELIETIEAHVRWVAEYLDSPAWDHKVTDILIDNSVHKGVIGLCWSRTSKNLRNIWVDARLDHAGELETLIHELSHAFSPAKDDHNFRFRSIYIVAWALYFNASNVSVRLEIWDDLARYQPPGFFPRHAENKRLLEIVAEARTIVEAERAQRQARNQQPQTT